MIHRAQHWTDIPQTGRQRKRTISNWCNWKNTQTGLWVPTNQQVESNSAPYDWQGNYDFQRQILEGPCQIFLGDSTDPTNTALWGMRRADNTGAWVNFKMLNVNPVSPTFNAAGRWARWNDIQQNTDLILQALKFGVRKWIRIKALPAGPTFRFTMRLPPGYTHEILNSSVLVIKDDQGEEQLRSRPVHGVSGTVSGPDNVAEGVDIPVTLTYGDDITIGQNTYPTLLVSPDANVAQDVIDSGKEVWLDPTATVSGISDIDDTMLISNNATTNYGSSATVQCGNVSAGHDYSTLWKIATSAIPAGPISVFNHVAWRRDWLFGHNNNGGTHEYYACKRDWGELTATYNTYDGSNSWDSGGCMGDGVDYVSDATPPSLTFPAFNGQPDTLQSPVSLDEQWCRDWKSGSLANYGFVVLNTDYSATSNGYMWLSSNDPTNPAYFEIEYARSNAVFLPLLNPRIM